MFSTILKEAGTFTALYSAVLIFKVEFSAVCF